MASANALRQDVRGLQDEATALRAKVAKAESAQAAAEVAREQAQGTAARARAEAQAAVARADGRRQSMVAQLAQATAALEAERTRSESQAKQLGDLMDR